MFISLIIMIVFSYSTKVPLYCIIKSENPDVSHNNWFKSSYTYLFLLLGNWMASWWTVFLPHMFWFLSSASYLCGIFNVLHVAFFQILQFSSTSPKHGSRYYRCAWCPFVVHFHLTSSVSGKVFGSPMTWPRRWMNVGQRNGGISFFFLGI